MNTIYLAESFDIIFIKWFFLSSFCNGKICEQKKKKRITIEISIKLKEDNFLLLSYSPPLNLI